jgi:hypothetical protein
MSLSGDFPFISVGPISQWISTFCISDTIHSHFRSLLLSRNFSLDKSISSYTHNELDDISQLLNLHTDSLLSPFFYSHSAPHKYSPKLLSFLPSTPTLVAAQGSHLVPPNPQMIANSLFNPNSFDPRLTVHSSEIDQLASSFSKQSQISNKLPNKLQSPLEILNLHQHLSSPNRFLEAHFNNLFKPYTSPIFSPSLSLSSKSTFSLPSVFEDEISLDPNDSLYGRSDSGSVFSYNDGIDISNKSSIMEKALDSIQNLLEHCDHPRSIQLLIDTHSPRPVKNSASSMSTNSFSGCGWSSFGSNLFEQSYDLIGKIPIFTISSLLQPDFIQSDPSVSLSAIQSIPLISKASQYSSSYLPLTDIYFTRNNDILQSNPTKNNLLNNIARISHSVSLNFQTNAAFNG